MYCNDGGSFEKINLKSTIHSSLNSTTAFLKMVVSKASRAQRSRRKRESLVNQKEKNFTQKHRPSTPCKSAKSNRVKIPIDPSLLDDDNGLINIDNEPISIETDDESSIFEVFQQPQLLHHSSHTFLGGTSQGKYDSSDEEAEAAAEIFGRFPSLEKASRKDKN